MNELYKGRKGTTEESYEVWVIVVNVGNYVCVVKSCYKCGGVCM